MPTLRLPVGAVRATVRAVSPALTGASLGIERQRARAEIFAGLLVPPLGTRVRPVELGGVTAERVSRDSVAGDGALLYLHGGGYCIGSPRLYRGLVSRLVAATGLVGYVPHYRLAPEHPHPAALEDALSAYRALLAGGIEPGRIVVAGDSAGGGLSLALSMALRDEGLPQPAVIALVCAWLDLVTDYTGGVRRRPAGEALLTPEALTLWARAYANGYGPDEPAVSPLYGDLSGLAPLIVQSAGDDVLAPDSEALVQRAEEGGAVDIEHLRVDGVWHVAHIFVGLMSEADAAADALAGAINRRLKPGWPRVAIVGAGMSGLCMGETLKRAAINDFTVYESAREVGGTWRDNRYPGLSCDVPSRFYSYSFAPNPGWTSAFSPGPEIQDYFVRISRERGLRDHIRFNAEVTNARWADGVWTLRTSDGRSSEADVVVTATGVLRVPRLPDIPGRDSFAGPAFHSARWEDGVELAGKRVAVIGTGSTGVQITVATGGVAERLLLFQRTAQWIAPIPNREYSALTRAVMRAVPPLNTLVYRVNQEILERVLGAAVTRPGWQRRLLSSFCRANLRFGVRDPELRARLTPDYEPMCKRLVLSSGFYPTMQRDDVELVSTGIERIEPRGIVTADGVLHEVDVIVFATGFHAHAYVRPMTIEGAGGVTLEEAWRDGPRAYQTIALPDFPNLFTIMGPHSPIGNFSLIAIAESQARYVLWWIERMRQDGLRSVAPKAAATDEYYGAIKAALPNTVWVTGCDSWYLDKNGDPELWPWTPMRHSQMLSRPEPADFEVEPIGSD